jgi:hypothetical protein
VIIPLVEKRKEPMLRKSDKQEAILPLGLYGDKILGNLIQRCFPGRRVEIVLFKDQGSIGAPLCTFRITAAEVAFQ